MSEKFNQYPRVEGSSAIAVDPESYDVGSESPENLLDIIEIEREVKQIISEQDAEKSGQIIYADFGREDARSIDIRNLSPAILMQMGREIREGRELELKRQPGKFLVGEKFSLRDLPLITANTFFEKRTEAELMEIERRRVGSRIYESATGYTIFLGKESNHWFAHHEFTNQKGEIDGITTHYELLPDGRILKSNSLGSTTTIVVGDELRNFVQSVAIYHNSALKMYGHTTKIDNLANSSQQRTV